MSAFDYEMSYLAEARAQLENYLMSSELYWSIGISSERGQPPYPVLTLGNVLLSQMKARAYATSISQRAFLQKITDQIDQIHMQWRFAWEQKSIVEYRSRLNLWRNFLMEYRDHPESHYDRYGFEVNRRVLLQLLELQAEILPEAEGDLLSVLDSLLNTILIAGDFIWDEALIQEFPRDTFWYLYGQLPACEGTS